MSVAGADSESRLTLPARHAAGALRRRTLLVVSVVLLALGAAVAWWRWPRGAHEPVYRTALVERRTIVRVVEATGRIDVERRLEVPATAPGSLAELLVARGDRVTKDQALARLNPSSADASAREADASVAAASTRVAAARLDLRLATERRERVEGLFRDHFVKRSDVDAALAEEERAQAALKSAEAERGVTSQRLSSAKRAVSVLTLRSPIDGIVLNAPEALGAAVTPDKGPLFEIGTPLELMRVEAAVTEADIGAVKTGLRVEFSVPAFPGRTFAGSVDRIGVDPTHGPGVVSYPVALLAKNPENLLRPGMTADVKIFVAEARDVIAVREVALRFTPDADGIGPRTRVYVSSNGFDLDVVPVTPGTSDGAFTEIQSAVGRTLKPGDRVAIGFLKLDAGAHSGPGISLGKP